MAGKRRKKQKKLAETAGSNDETKKDEVELLQIWSDLPAELLQLIMCRLKLDDNVRASSVCTTWHSAALSVRVVDQPPWLLFLPKSGNLCQFYDPLHRKIYSRELPLLSDSEVRYSKDGWLLLYMPKTRHLGFSNPSTHEFIKLPRLKLKICQMIAFSCAPTSNSCVVFTVRHLSSTVVAISTFRIGETKWTTVTHHNHYWWRYSFSSGWDKVVFYNERFYSLSQDSWLGVFNPQERTWNVLDVPPPKLPENFVDKNWWRGKFLTEHKGDLFLMYTCSDENPIIFKLGLVNMMWEQVKTLNGVTFFASFLSSVSRGELPGSMRNNVYFPKVRFYGKQCISYSMGNERYYPRNECHDWGEEDMFDNIWIEPLKYVD
ncbi:hypothetical protein ACFE04_009439 [Oxalis oulophora]